jgi:hypothetical protein
LLRASLTRSAKVVDEEKIDVVDMIVPLMPAL